MAEPVKPKVFKAWITKYALTGGIREADMVLTGDSKYARIPEDKSYMGYSKDEWHRTEAAAKVRAEQMRVERIASLKKQIKKLEGMKF